MQNGHRNRGFTHNSMVIFHVFLLVESRGYMILFLSESRKFPSECFHKNSFGFRLNEEFVVAPRPKRHAALVIFGANLRPCTLW
jgi:hypothetical protein